jgi:hypothetical protein
MIGKAAMKPKPRGRLKPRTNTVVDQKLEKALETLRKAYQRALLSHQKAGIYGYLEQVYKRTRSVNRGEGEKRGLERLESATGRKFRKGTALASALVQATSSEKLHKQVRSKWVRVIEKAMSLNIKPERFEHEVRVEKEGMNRFLGFDANTKQTSRQKSKRVDSKDDDDDW